MKDAMEPEVLLFTKVTIDVVTEDCEVVSSLALEKTYSRPASSSISTRTLATSLAPNSNNMSRMNWGARCVLQTA
jgi:hypothetical protein